MALQEYWYVADDKIIAGTPILTPSPVTMLTVDQTTSQCVFSGITGSDLTSAPYGYNPPYPLMLKLFCDNVEVDSTGEFKIKIEGPAFKTIEFPRRNFNDLDFRRNKEKNFAFTWYVKDWATKANIDATVSVHPYPPITSVSFQCICGLAENNINWPEQN
jgi:hypothetical protein